MTAIKTPAAPKSPKAPKAGKPAPAPAMETAVAKSLASHPIPLAQVRVVAGWNVRTLFDDAEAAELRASMHSLGMLQPVVVTRDAVTTPAGTFKCERPGEVNLVAGERRVRAARALGWESIEAVEVSGDVAAAMLAENFKRAEVTHADRVRFVVGQRKAGVPFTAIGAMVGKSEQTVINDHGIGTKLLPEIFEAWAKHPGASKFALENYNKPAEAQRAAWGEYLAHKTESGGKNKRGPNKPAAGNSAVGADGDVQPGKRSKGELSKMYADLVAVTAVMPATDEYHNWVMGATWALEFMASTEVKVPTEINRRIDAMKNPKQAKLFA